MIQTLNLFRSRLSGVIFIFSIAAISILSCTKGKSDSGGNDAAKFVGTWNGSACGTPGSLVLAAGSNGSTVTNSFTVGNPGCVKSVSLNITASGNNLTIATQNFTDDCGLSYTLSGSGSLSGGTISLTINVSGAVPTTSCTFTGTK